MRISDWNSDVCSSDLPRSLAFSAAKCVAGSDVYRLPRHRHRGFLDRFGMRRVGVAGVGDVLARRAEFHRLRGLRDHRARDARDAPHAEHAIRFRIGRSEEHTSELQALMRISYAVFCLK